MRYYKNGEPYHAGVIREGDDIYYISSRGRAVKGEHVVHGEMCNGILKRGTYTFGDDYKLIEGSYCAPREKKKKRRSRKNAKKKQQQKMIIGIAAAILVVVVSIGIGIFLDEPKPPITDKADTEQTPLSDAMVTLPTFDEEVLLCTELAKRVYDHTEDIAEVTVYTEQYRPFVFEYQLAGAAGVLRLSEDSAMTDCREYVLEQDQTSINIDNLKVATTYYYQVLAGEKTYDGSFTTARSNRFLSIPGLKNVRDIGGYQTLDGKTVKQGMLIRGVELDGVVNTAFFIPTETLDEVQDTFGFVYDMDLRAPETHTGPYQSRLGEEVGHRFYASPMYGEIFTAERQAAVRAIFSDLADPAKYPMYLHCTWGADRTGTITFLLQGLLNMSEEDMVQEYRLTGFAMGGNFFTNTSMDVVIAGLQSYEGDTLQEKVVSYLTDTVGVTEEEIASIRSILLE